MSLKKLQEQEKKKSTETVQDSDEVSMQDVLVTQIILENSTYFLLGAYYSFCKLKQLEPVNTDDIAELLVIFKKSKNLEQLLHENQGNSLYTFLTWYLNDDNSRT